MFNFFNILLQIVSSFGYLFISSRLLKVKFEFNKPKTYGAIFLLTVIMSIISFLKVPILESAVMFFSLFLINTWLFSKSITDSIAIVTFLFLFICFFDIIFSSIIFIFKMKVTLVVKLIANILTIIFSHFFVKLSFVNKIINYLTSKHPKRVLSLMTIILFVFYLFSMILCQNFDSLFVLSICIILLMLSYIILISLLLEKSKNDHLDSHYKQVLEMVELCEKMIDEQRIAHHENMNQLLVVKTLVHNKKVEEYIDHLLKEDYSKFDQKFLMAIHDLPFSVLKGFLYYKYFDSKNRDICLKVEVGSKVKSLNEDDLTTEEVTNILKIMGVFVDNAVEETEKYHFEEVKITIFRDHQNRLLITVANQLGGIIRCFDEMFASSTKGKGHGYGLLLVRDIIKKYPKFQHKTEIVGDILIQSLVINLDE